MILGEGSTVFALEKDNGQKAVAKIIGLGFATEMIEHNASLSSNADCLQKSMKMALKDAEIENVDSIIMHAPGTTQGDNAELNAIKEVFKHNIPHLTVNKHLCGHTLGNSGALSLEMATLMLQNSTTIDIPYQNITQEKNTNPNTILINAVGFGGNAVSIIIKKA
jgi:3-oxoacyl-(acyl-carrier-protein) synthase